MKKRYQPTEEQKQKALERRAAFRQLNQKLAAMNDDERAAFSNKMIAVMRCVGGALSYTNSMLVWMQRENATMVGGFDQWRLCGRKVKKGGTGISIWIPKGSTKEDEATPSTEEQRPGFFMGYVYDIADTEPLEGVESDAAAPVLPVRRAAALTPAETSLTSASATVDVQPSEPVKGDVEGAISNHLAERMRSMIGS